MDGRYSGAVRLERAIKWFDLRFGALDNASTSAKIESYCRESVSP
jgi:hypothetical protein